MIRKITSIDKEQNKCAKLPRYTNDLGGVVSVSAVPSIPNLSMEKEVSQANRCFS